LKDWQKYLLLALTVFGGAAPGLANSLTAAGLPSWAHFVALAASGAGSLALLFAKPPAPPSAGAAAGAAAAIVAVMVAIGACTPAELATLKTVETDVAMVLTASQEACAVASPFVSIPAIMTACNIDQTLAPSVEDALNKAETLGTRKLPHTPLDAGTKDAAGEGG
jgi:hypothetical protein